MVAKQGKIASYRAVVKRNRQIRSSIRLRATLLKHTRVILGTFPYPANRGSGGLLCRDRTYICFADFFCIWSFGPKKLSRHQMHRETIAALAREVRGPSWHRSIPIEAMPFAPGTPKPAGVPRSIDRGPIEARRAENQRGDGLSMHLLSAVTSVSAAICGGRAYRGVGGRDGPVPDVVKRQSLLIPRQLWPSSCPKVRKSSGSILLHTEQLA